MSRPRKARQRARLRHVDKVVSIVDQALSRIGLTTKATERWKAEMPTEAEMRPKDKYTIFARNEKNYRKGIHSESLMMFTCPWFFMNKRDTNKASHDRIAKMDKSFTTIESAWILKHGLLFVLALH
jgi:Mitochondrial ribosomal protein L31